MPLTQLFECEVPLVCLRMRRLVRVFLESEFSSKENTGRPCRARERQAAGDEGKTLICLSMKDEGKKENRNRKETTNETKRNYDDELIAPTNQTQ